MTGRATLGFACSLATKHFDFVAYGETEELANEAMERALSVHARQYDLPADWADAWEAITVPIEVGGYRDGERIDNAPPPAGGRK